MRAYRRLLSRFLAIFIMIAAATPAAGQGSSTSFEIERFHHDGKVITAIVSVKNTASTMLRMGMIECAFFDELGQTVDSGAEAALAVAPGGVTQVQVQADYKPTMVDADCRVSFEYR